MSDVVLGPIFAYPVHRSGWRRPVGDPGYRVTNGFAGPDLVNGGKHQATDLGNFRQGDPLRAPVTCRARGLKHFDGALGVEFDLGGGVIVGLWHLDRVDLPKNWTPVVRGQVVGITGDSGGPLKDGSPMPQHTHVAGMRDGEPFDVEPALFGAPIVIQEDRMSAVGTGTVGPGVNLREGPSTTFAKTFTTVEQPHTEVELVAYKADGGEYEAVGQRRRDWWQVRRNDDHWCAAAFVGNRASPLFPGDCGRERNALDAIATAATGARQAIDAIQGLAKR